MSARRIDGEMRRLREVAAREDLLSDELLVRRNAGKLLAQPRAALEASLRFERRLKVRVPQRAVEPALKSPQDALGRGLGPRRSHRGDRGKPLQQSMSLRPCHALEQRVAEPHRAIVTDRRRCAKRSLLSLLARAPPETSRPTPR
jgi:hypothetical protein